MKLKDENGEGWEVKQLLYADDTVSVSKTEEYLQYNINEFEMVCDSMGLKINVG